jgi:hypothetical protein
MFQLPNRVYFVQFAGMSQAHLDQTVGNMLLYTGFQVFSLIATHVAVFRLLRFSPWHQLGFVLTRQAAHIQSALVVSMIYSTQASLDHFGKSNSLALVCWIESDSLRL